MRLLRLFVRRVLAAELAVLAELQTIRIVLLVLVRAIVAAMALRALKRNVVAHEYQLSSISSCKITLTNLSYLENAVNVCRAFSQKSIKEPPKRGQISKWWRHRDLNSGHCGYEPHALAN